MRSTPKQYSEEEIQFIQSNYNKMTTYALAEKLNRRQGEISLKIKRLGLRTEESQQSLAKKGQRRCIYCKRILPLESFALSGTNRRQSGCKECQSSFARASHYRHYDSLEIYANKIVTQLKRRRECSLEPADIVHQFKKQDGKCFFSGQPLALVPCTTHTVSVDRLDPTKPYSVDNIALCCHIVNLMKQRLHVQDFREWCSAICQNVKESLLSPVQRPYANWKRDKKAIVSVVVS